MKTFKAKNCTYRLGEIELGVIKISWRNIGLGKISIRISIEWGW